MLTTLAISGYRSIRDLVLPLGSLNLITGPNGSGKSSLYRALRLLADASSNAVVASLAREGGLSSTLWAGPEIIGRTVRQGQHPVEPTVRSKPVSLKLGFANDTYGYSIDLGYPPPSESAFSLDPAIKRECIWHGGVYRRSASLVERRNGFVYLPASGDEPTMLTSSLGNSDSMLASIADPQRAPEMLALRESIRSWRFYDAFRTDALSPVRIPQIGTFTPILHHDGSDLPSALQTILEIGDASALQRTIEDAFPGSRVKVESHGGRFELNLRQHGLLRPLSAAELSDGTLRFLLWTAALLSPRPPELMVLNEPETSLHPDLLPALARLLIAASRSTQLIVVSHAPALIDVIQETGSCHRFSLRKSLGETTIEDTSLLNARRWEWPPR